MKLRSQLDDLNKLQVSRCVTFSSDPRSVQVFATLAKAYGACEYIRKRLESNEYHIELLCSKSRVAPFKAISLPRLELCAALLGAFNRKDRRILKFSAHSNNISLIRLHYCTK